MLKTKVDLTLPVETAPSTEANSNVETTDSNETEHVETSPNAKIIGTLVTKTIGLKKHKKQFKAKCKLCDEICDSIKDLNSHHRSYHDVQFCDDCGKGFSTKRH